MRLRGAAPIANAARNRKEGTGNRVTWTQPTGRGEVVITQGGSFNGWTGDSEDFGVYHRFTPEDLATINGGTLSQVAFVPTHLIWFIPGHIFTIQIYRGGIWGEMGNRNPGTLMSSQELNNNDLLFNQENTISLENQVSIDASQELWIGYYCTNIDSITTPKDPAPITNL
jgi:hypothetical protein